jgi:hypothetical protein
MTYGISWLHHFNLLQMLCNLPRQFFLTSFEMWHTTSSLETDVWISWRIFEQYSSCCNNKTTSGKAEESSRTGLRPSKPPMLSLLGTISPEVKWPGYEAAHSLSSSAEIKDKWSYIFSPPCDFMICKTNLYVLCVHSKNCMWLCLPITLHAWVFVITLPMK